MPIFVNNVEITDDDVHAEMQNHPAESADKARHKAGQALVLRQLLLQAAKAKNMLEDVEQIDNVLAEETIDTLIQQEVVVPQPITKAANAIMSKIKTALLIRALIKCFPLIVSMPISATIFMPVLCRQVSTSISLCLLAVLILPDLIWKICNLLSVFAYAAKTGVVRLNSLYAECPVNILGAIAYSQITCDKNVMLI